MCINNMVRCNYNLPKNGGKKTTTAIDNTKFWNGSLIWVQT